MPDLSVLAGQRSLAGRKPQNDDSVALVIPDVGVIRRKGVVAVIADGVSASERGGEAAEVAVRTFVQDYYSTPDTWRVQKSLARVVAALNRWLYGQSLRTLGEARGYVCTFSGVILRQARLHVFHVGDSRVWRWRDGVLQRLTEDHELAVGKGKAYLTRALGLDASLELDYRRHTLRAGDVILLATDGLYRFVGTGMLEDVLAQAAGAESPEQLEALCQFLIQRALEAGSDDNISLQILRVVHPGEAAPPERSEVNRVRFPPLLKAGDRLDGFEVETEIYASERCQVYRVRGPDGRRCVMKTPSPNYVDDAAYIERFLLESWAGRRAQSPHVVRVLSRPDSPWLYYLTEWVEGVTLEQWMLHHHHPDVKQVVNLMRQLVQAVRVFHRRDMYHGDLKPANVLIDLDGQVRLLDFGSVWVGAVRDCETEGGAEIPLGTTRYSAPEYQQGEPPSLQSELFSLGVMAYEMLTGEHPYGKGWEDAGSPSARARMRYVPAWQHNPLVPAWVDAALARAVAPDKRTRYASLSEWLRDMQTPNRKLVPDAPQPLMTRDPVRGWQLISAGLMLAWLVTLWAWLAH